MRGFKKPHCASRTHEQVDRGGPVEPRGDDYYGFFFFSSRRRHTRYWRDWSSDVCSSDLLWHASTVHSLLSLQTFGVPPTHCPLLSHVACSMQASGSHDGSLFLFRNLHAPVDRKSVV